MIRSVPCCDDCARSSLGAIGVDFPAATGPIGSQVDGSGGTYNYGYPLNPASDPANPANATFAAWLSQQPQSVQDQVTGYQLANPGSVVPPGTTFTPYTPPATPVNWTYVAGGALAFVAALFLIDSMGGGGGGRRRNPHKRRNQEIIVDDCGCEWDADYLRSQGQLVDNPRKRKAKAKARR